MKAYRHDDGSLWLFRPEMNATRFVQSAHRLALPPLPEADFVAAVEALVRTMPTGCRAAARSRLYLRPFMFASEVFLGVRAAREVTFAIIASPAGAYFSGGVQPVSIWLSEYITRAGTGGTGAAKCGGNYASSLLAQQEAAATAASRSSSWTRREHESVEELGGMNFFLVSTPTARSSRRSSTTRSSPGSPAPPSSSSPTTSVTRSTSAGDVRRSGARASRAARSARCSPAALPPSSLRWPR